MSRENVPKALMRRHHTSFMVLVFAVTLCLNAWLQRAPAPPPGTESQHCVTLTPLWGGFRHLMNCDSYEFMRLAKQPSLVLTPEHNLWQSRPAFGAVAHLIALPLEPLRRWGEHAPELTAYIVMNLVAVSAAALLFASLLAPAGGGTDPTVGPELLLPALMIITNDVTKAFFWTPHLQMLGILVPCFTLWLNARLIRYGRPLEPMRALALGLGIGVGLLVYGALLVTVFSVAALVLLVYRSIVIPLMIGVSSLIPLLTWYLYVRVSTGRPFYSHEVAAYRQFVWVGDCIASGLSACTPVVLNNVSRLLVTLTPVLLLPLLLLGVARLAHYCLARHIWSVARPVAGDGDEHRVIGLAVLFQLGTALTFLYFMGYYAPRLSWALVPAILLLFANDLRDLRRAVPRTGRWLWAMSLVVGIAYFVLLVVQAGPYS